MNIRPFLALIAIVLMSACSPANDSSTKETPPPTPVARTAPTSMAIATSGDASSSSYHLSLTVGGGPKASAPNGTLTIR